jgi:hypothetical protein
MMTRTRRRLAAVTLLMACSAGMMTACGSDSEGASDTTAATGSGDDATTTTAGTGGDEGPSSDLCDAYVAISAAFGGEEAPDPATLTPLLDTLREDRPDEIADSIDVMLAAADKAVESKGEDTSAFEAPEFGEAQGKVDPYLYENCEFDSKAEVSAKDYAFEGIPDQVEAGETALLFTNNGEEAHELAIMRKKDGVTQTWDEILSLSEEEGQKLVEQAGGTFAPSKGKQGLAVVDLTPGEYVAICFIPTGTTFDEKGPHEGDGPPHFTKGMRVEFEVS